jgi:hypothetical protein
MCRTSYRKDEWNELKNDPVALELHNQRKLLSYLKTRDAINAKRRADRAKQRESLGIQPKVSKTTREAINARWDKWKAEHPEFFKRKMPQPQDPKAEYNGWARKAVSRSKHRAAERDIPFDLEDSDLNDPITGKLPVFCSILTYIRLDYSGGPDKRLWASVDRIRPKLGYTKENIRVISMAANMAKSDGEGDIIFPKSTPKTKLPNPDQPSLFDGL